MLSSKPLSGFLAAIFILLPALAEAQYFGRYQVQYEDFDFKVLQTDHFDIYHYSKTDSAIFDLGKLSERWYSRHSSILEHSFQGDNPLIIYANHADFQQTDVIPRVGVGTGGVTEGLRNRVIMPFAEANQSTNHVLGHELVHAFQYDIARRGNIGGIRAMSQLPLWFVEGMAEYLSLGPQDAQTDMYLRDALLNDNLPSIRDLFQAGEYFPYRYGHSVWSYIAGRWGDEAVQPFFIVSAKNGIKTAFNDVLGASMSEVSEDWQQAIRQTYSDEIEIRNKPSEVGEMVLGKEKGTGTINVAPELSPDGEYVAFISEKSLFSLDLFLADAETGEIIRTLASSDIDPHLSALRFIESSGSWSPNSEQFAVVVFAKGDNQIALIDVEDGELDETLSFKQVDAITNPAWSPDGNKIAFSGSDGAYTDLYLYNFETDSLQNLTRDRYSDLQPSWSPDGSKLAFVTDRGEGTNFGAMVFGNMKIAELDLDSGRIQIVSQFNDAKHINPKYSPDGQSLYYVSNRGGYNDIYRHDLSSGSNLRITNVATGISGISEYSPSITVARETGDMLASVFSESNYSVHRIDEEKRDGMPLGSGVNTESEDTPDSSLGSTGNRVLRSYIADPMTDLPDDTSFSVRDYKPVLQLDYITGGAGAGISNQFGVGVAGGITMSFSDMLNQHQLISTLRIQGRIKDIAGQVAYLNRDNRLIWGGSASHQTFRSTRTGISRNDTTTVDGEEVVAPVSVTRINQRIYRERLSAIGIYPLTPSTRFEVSGGFTHLWYGFEREQTYFDGLGRPFKRTTADAAIEEPDPLNLYNTTAAYVEDTSIFGFTGPIEGHRMRLEAERTFGSINYYQALADYRQYFFLRPFTLGIRALHYGRYTQDAQDSRLNPLYLGNERFIRGYNINSFTARECSDSPGEGCAEFDRLFGSRIAIANVELRMPLLGLEELALIESRSFPSTLSAFFDGGVAWNNNESPDLKWTTDETSENIPVFSTGLSLRVNIFGYLITEFYYAVPFQRPDKGGYFGFQISPGW